MPRILIIDDSPTVRMTLERLLAYNGYCVFLAKDGTDALYALKLHRPDLILLDVSMPRIDGMQLLQILRRGNDFASVPVIMLSGCSDQTAVDQVITSGADAFVTKPIESDALLQLVRFHLNAHL